MVTQRHLLGDLDLHRVEQAIRDAEVRTSGEIRVSVSPAFWGDVPQAAARAFDRMGMAQTRDRNGVLLFLVPSRRTLVIRGDEGIHARVGQAFWDRTAADLSRKFHEGDFTAGLVAAIATVADALAAHYPRRADDVNELPNRVDLGPPPS